jgi:hypothetical protein
MQYGEPTTSALVKSGSASRKLYMSAPFWSATAIPAGPDLLAQARTQPVEPDPGVDLVDEGMLDHAVYPWPAG